MSRKAEAPLARGGGKAVSERPHSALSAPGVTLDGSAVADSGHDQDLFNSQVTEPAQTVTTPQRARSTEAASESTAQPEDCFTLLKVCDDSDPNDNKNGGPKFYLCLQDRVAVRMTPMAHKDLERVTASDEDIDMLDFSPDHLDSSRRRGNGESVSDDSVVEPGRPSMLAHAGPLAPKKGTGTLRKGETSDRGPPGALLGDASRAERSSVSLADWASQEAHHESMRQAMEERHRSSETTAMEAFGASQAFEGALGAKLGVTPFKANKGCQTTVDDESILPHAQGLRSRKTSSAYSSSPPAGPTTPCRKARARLRACSSSVTEEGGSKASPGRPWTLGGKPWSPTYNGLALHDRNADASDVGIALQSTADIAQLSLEDVAERAVGDSATSAMASERHAIDCELAVEATNAPTTPPWKSIEAFKQSASKTDSVICNLDHTEKDERSSLGSGQHEASDTNLMDPVKRPFPELHSILTAKDTFQENAISENDSKEGLAELMSSCEDRQHNDRVEKFGLNDASTAADFVETVMILVLLSVVWVLASAKNA